MAVGEGQGVFARAHTLGSSMDSGLNRVPREGPPTCRDVSNLACGAHGHGPWGALRKLLPGSPPWWRRCCATGSWSATRGRGLAGSSCVCAVFKASWEGEGDGVVATAIVYCLLCIWPKGFWSTCWTLVYERGAHRLQRHVKTPPFRHALPSRQC